MPNVKVEHLSKLYKLDRLDAKVMRRSAKAAKSGEAPPAAELWALKDVSFEVGPGTILGIVGRNGAGKTTLLKILGRVTPPTEGRAEMSGRVVSLLEVGAGFVAESTGRDNVFLNAALFGIPRSVVQRRFDQIVEFAELEKFIDTPVTRYSSGMYLRLAFSVAINMEPDILLADEVLAVGDIDFQQRCLERVEEDGRQGLTTLFVSHDTAAIRRLCHRVIWLDAGEMQSDGPPEQVVTEYETSQAERTKRRSRPGVRSKLDTAYGNIAGTRLLSPDGTQIGSARLGDEVQVEVTLRTLRPASAVRCGVTLFTEGSPALSSVQTETFEAETPGDYRIVARVPGDLLADKFYTVRTTAVLVVAGTQKRLTELDALAFRVYDAGARGAAPSGFSDRLEGVVRPALDWSLVGEPELEASASR
ncbi:MAG: ABC transporter ATP-binding protein [Thermoleophilaceae bacterium]